MSAVNVLGFEVLFESSQGVVVLLYR